MRDKGLLIFFAIFGAAFLFAGLCSKRMIFDFSNLETIKTNVVENVQSVSLEEGTPSGLDKGEVNPINNGYVHLDFDGDDVNDFIILKGNTLMYSKSNNGNIKPILTINGNIVAYNVISTNGQIQLLYWDNNNKGWYRKMMGINNGIPYFGNVEKQ